MALRGNQSTARALNRRLILDQLRRDGPMSRAAIAAAVGLSPAAITLVTADLINEGLLTECDALPGSSGRRPIPLDIDYGSRFSVGLKVTVGHVIGVVTNLATRVLAEVEVPLTAHDPETVVVACAEASERLLESAGVSRDALIGVGVALSGQVDAEAGICRQVQRFGWRDVPIAALFANLVSVPVWIDNDTNAFAVSQHLFGHGRGKRNIAAIALGLGVGAGLIVDGRLYRGTGGAAGEFGHSFDRAGRICECGRDGCMETYCSDPGLIRTWVQREPSAAGKGPEDLNAAADAGDPTAREILRESGIRLGRHVAALVNVVDPEIIVFGGEGVRFGDHLFGPLRGVLAEVCYSGPPALAIDLPETSWPRGAATLAIQHFFNFEATGGFAPKSSEQSVSSLAIA
ncbi:ROK family protein [Bauldia sp.]|uniref:ROK family protein n=1 Tax=Bauldia sp. TaxID=2575872 RepID=UPI003BAC174B